MSFASLGLPDYFVNTLTGEGYTSPYPIQMEAIPAVLSKKDVLGIAPTGSGKTAGYVLPILTNLATAKTAGHRHVGVLVLVPTRELAVQVEEVFRVFGEAVRYQFKSLAVHGGVSINPQMKALMNVNVLVATPGRLLELAEANALQLSAVHTLVLDEADKMLNLGFKKEMERIFSLLPARRQNLLFSATLSPDVKDMGQLLLNNPQVINVVPDEESNMDLIRQTAYSITDEHKGPLLRSLIKKNEMHRVLVFTSSTYRADLVADKLVKHGIKAKAIHSKKSQGSRTDSLTQFKAGKLTVLVATDLLSRGIDIEFLPFVINYELPRSPKDFVHRIGRTGRAQNPGEAISFITPDDEHHFKVIQKKMKKEVPLTYVETAELKGF